MLQVDSFHTGNIVLSALSTVDRALLQPRFVRVELMRGMQLVAPGEPISYIYFPESGVASITALAVEHGPTEVGIFGREGFSGTAVLLGTDRTPLETFIQVGGGTALRTHAVALLEAIDRSATLRTTLLRFVQAMTVQAAQSAVLNAHYQLEAKLARWLLMCHDRVDGDEIALTHEFMAIMIAARRSAVTLALHALEGAGLIRSNRGRVVILDREKMEELAGDGYGQPEAEYRRLIGPFGKGAGAANGPKLVGAY